MVWISSSSFASSFPSWAKPTKNEKKYIFVDKPNKWPNFYSASNDMHKWAITWKHVFPFNWSNDVKIIQNHRHSSAIRQRSVIMKFIFQHRCFPVKPFTEWNKNKTTQPPTSELLGTYQCRLWNKLWKVHVSSEWDTTESKWKCLPLKNLPCGLSFMCYHSYTNLREST